MRRTVGGCEAKGFVFLHGCVVEGPVALRVDHLWA